VFLKKSEILDMNITKEKLKVTLWNNKFAHKIFEEKLLEVLNKRKEIISERIIYFKNKLYLLERTKTCSDHHEYVNFTPIPSINSFSPLIRPNNFKPSSTNYQASFTPKIDSNSNKLLNSNILKWILNRYTKDVLDIYNKTVSYLRNNHGSPEVKDGDEIINNRQQENNSFINIDTLLEEEIEKYNRLKSQKQKEAKFFYKEEAKRMKMMESMRMREQKLLGLKEKSVQDKVKKNLCPEIN